MTMKERYLVTVIYPGGGSIVFHASDIYFKEDELILSLLSGASHSIHRNRFKEFRVSVVA